MARVEINYNCEEEIERILKTVKECYDLDHDKEKVKSSIKEIIQLSFEEGRKFQKNYPNLNVGKSGQTVLLG